MQRTLQLDTLNHPTLRLKQALLVQLNPSEAGVVATVGQWQAEAPTITQAVNDLADAIVGAILAKQPEALQLVADPLAGQQPPPTPVPAPETPQSANTVYVLLNNGMPVGVTRNKGWAERWKKWRETGTFNEFQLEELP